MKRLPTLTPKKVAQALVHSGFVLQRIKGSHHCYKYPSKPEIKVIVPFHGKDIKRPLLYAIIKQADMTVEEFLDLL
jgi:predicted RNA binding protein YcfA (HicA-like mRNA interferase family)